jgi:hypothetical protein
VTEGAKAVVSWGHAPPLRVPPPTVLVGVGSLGGLGGLNLTTTVTTLNEVSLEAIGSKSSWPCVGKLPIGKRLKNKATEKSVMGKLFCLITVSIPIDYNYIVIER